MHAVVIDGIAAIVNDDVITKSEVYAAEKLDLDLAGLPERSAELQDRIDVHLVLQQLVNQPPVEISEEDVRSAINSYVQKHGGEEEFLLFLNSIGMNYADFEKEVRNEITIHQFLGSRFRPFVNITLEEAEEYYNKVYKPGLEKSGKPTPAFAESFNDIQNLLVESQRTDKIEQWLNQIRQSATINIK